MSEDTRINRNRIRQFKCTNCGGELELQNRRSQYVSCPYCGSVADSSSEAYKVLTKMENPAKFPPMSFIKIGMEGRFNGKMYHVIGRTRRKYDYLEYWNEEGEEGYSHEEWIADEWLLISEDATYLYLIEDSEGYSISKAILPKYPTIPKDKSMADFVSNKARRATEYGKSQIIYYEGESTYLVKTYDVAGFSEYRYRGKTYSAEWRYKDHEIKEIEFFEEEDVSKSELLRAFNIKQAGEQTRKTKRKKGRLKISLIVGIFAVINLLIGIFLPEETYSSKITEIMKEEFSISELAKNQDWKIINDSLKAIYYSKKIEVEPEIGEIKIEISMNDAPISGECLADFLLIDDKYDTVFYDRGYIYKYVYNDNLGAFHAATSIQSAIKRDSTTQTYTMKAEVKIPINQTDIDINSKIKLSLSIQGEEFGRGSNSPLLFLGLLFLLIFVLLPLKFILHK